MIFNIIKSVAGFFLGSGANLGTANRVAGVVNYAWLLPVLGWIWFHRAENITIQVVLAHAGKPETLELLTTTYFGLSIIVVAVFAFIEFGRRAP